MDTEQKLPLIKNHMPMRIGLLGGTFDPLHLGHQMLALNFLAQQSIDQLWVLPCYNQAGKPPAIDFDHRLRMCQIAFSRLSQTYVNDMEQHLSAPSYTVNTLSHIKKRYPQLELVLAIGSDIVESFPSWHNAASIKLLATIAIFERQEHPISRLPAELAGAHIHSHVPIPNVNSSHLRKLLEDGDFIKAADFLDSSVLQYIKENQLYVSCGSHSP